MAGRPTSYTKEVLEKARQYRDNPLPQDEVIHSIEGLADYINIARSTIYDWCSQDDKKEFSDIVENILEKQGKSLINNGLIGKFSAPITKVILTKHNYREGQEISGVNGEPVQLAVESKEKISEAIDKIISN